MHHFQPIIRNTNYLFPPSINDWLPEVHLARFVVEIVEQLDLSEMERAVSSGAPAISSKNVRASALSKRRPRTKTRWKSARLVPWTAASQREDVPRRPLKKVRRIKTKSISPTKNRAS